MATGAEPETIRSFGLLKCEGMLRPPLSIVHTPAAQRLARVRVFSQFLRELCEYVVQRAAAHTGLRPIP